MGTWPIITESDKARVMQCLDDKTLWRGNGKFLFELESEFANLHQTEYALAVTNGTHALEIALEALGIGYGDEVLIPAYTFIATATAVLMRNALPIPVEVDPYTFCMDPSGIVEMITERTKAIIPVHISGHACKMDEIMDIAAKYNLFVIEDCAHAHGSRYKNRMLGSIGDFGAFSFQAVKTMTAGEGGLLLAKNRELWMRAYNFFNCGRMPEGPSYNHVSLSSNYRMSELQAALLVGQIERVPDQIEQRSQNVAYLNRLLANTEGILPQGRAEYASVQGYSMYMFRYLPDEFGGLAREAFLELLNAEGFPAFRTYPVFYTTSFFHDLYLRQKQFAHLRYKPNYSEYHHPVSAKISTDVIWLPHSFLLSERNEFDRFAETIAEIQRTSRGTILT